MGRDAALTKIGEIKQKLIRVRGGNNKRRALSLPEVMFYDAKTKKMQKAKMINVEQNLANRHYKRANIITKGAIVNTDKGIIKITNRPGQEGIAQGVKIEFEVAQKTRSKKG